MIDNRELDGVLIGNEVYRIHTEVSTEEAHPCTSCDLLGWCIKHKNFTRYCINALNNHQYFKQEAP